MQLSQRLDQRLHMLRQEVRTMSHEGEREERVWRERLQRCQRQLKAKDEEMSRQSQYFENFKIQLQQKLSLARDREQSLQNRICSLEKQLLDVTVSSATGMATIKAVRITAGTVIHMNELDKLPSMRGEGEGEEENKEERRKQWWPNVATVIKERTKVDEDKTETDIEGGRDKETKLTSSEAKLQGFIISLQEDLKVLLEREEDGMTERRKLLEELQEAQENNHFLGCKVEAMKAELHQLRHSESSLMEEVEDLRKENQSLQQIVRDSANPTPLLSSLKPEATCTISRADLPRCSPDIPFSPLSSETAIGQTSTGSLGEVQPHADVFAIQPIDHQGAAEHTQNNTEDQFLPAESKTPKQNPLNLFHHTDSEPNPGFQSLSFCTEFVIEPKLGNVEEIPSEASDALRAAFHSLGFGDNLKALKEQRDLLEVELQDTKAELQAITQENTELNLQLRRETEQQQSVKVQRSSKEKIITPSTSNIDHHLPLNPAEDDTVQGELNQALNQENRALGNRIQELLAHIKLREEETKKEQTHLRECICRLEEDGVRLEQENQEQVSLISELTKKTEDDLNTIMELQQKLEENKEEPQVKQHCRTLWQSEHQAGISRCFQQKKQKECVESLVESVLKGDKETQLIFSQETDSLTTASSSGCQQNVQRDTLQNHSQNSLHVSSLTDEVAQLNSSILSLKTEQKELTGNISSLREEQKEVTLLLQRQTEEKQHLTRSVWALKEQRDCIFQSLHGLKHDKEQLSRAVSSLKDERDQYTRSISGLKEEKEELTRSLSTLQKDKDVIKESISSGEEESDRIMKSLQGLRTESEQLGQTVLHLKKQRDKLTDSLKGLTDQKELIHTLKGEHDQLRISVNNLKEEKEKVEQSIICLKQEQRNIEQIILGLREEKCSLQTQAEETNHELNLISDDMTKRTGNGDNVPRCETSNNRAKSVQKESDLMREIEALRAELKKSREEVKKSHVEMRKLHTELSQSEARREVVEKKAAEQVMRLTESASQREDIMEENETLSVQTVALEELNSEYIALKREQGSRDDQTAALVSLRVCYNDIRAKYDALLKRKSQTDLDVAPLKAKLSCLVVKCQERNILLAELMKSMHREGCLEPRLMQQAEHLLCDAALQDYASAFSPESKIQHRENCSDFTQDFFSAFQGWNKGFMSEPTCPVVSSCLIKHQKEISAESGVESGEREKRTLIFASESLTNPQNCWKVAPVAAERLKESSPGSASPSSIRVSPVVPLKESMFTNNPQVSPATGSLKETSRPEKIDFLHLEVKDKNSSDTTEVGIHFHSPPTPSSSTRVSLSRRLSSPEKILNLQEELQKTLMDSFQASESRGRGKQPWRSLSPSATKDLNSPQPTRHFSFSVQFANSLPVSKFSSHTKHTPNVTTDSDTSNKSPTLFNAVRSRSANAKLSPSMFTPSHLKADRSKRQELLTSPDFPFNSATHRKGDSISSNDTELTTHTKQRKKVITMLDLSDVTHTNTFNTSCSQSARSSPERFHKAAVDSTAALENTSRPRQEAPAKVRSVEVIKTVGQSSLLIGWERPPLDELGCSNATFVYGYRVFVNKEFHKSVMSSACTKCILENIDLSVPVHIGVQTLGSNGLHSDSICTLYSNSNRE
ncbi:uncharacterized protein jakmip1 isoform 2-T7 [Anableps anableps]